MRVNRFHALAVKRAAPFRSAGGQSDGDRHCNVRAPVMRAGVIQDLIERDAGKIGELHLDNRPHSVQRRPDRRADDCVFTDRRVQHPPGKFFGQTFGCFKRAAESSADVLPVNENALVITQQFRLRFTDRFEISDAHWACSTSARVEIAHQSSFASGAASFCAIVIA